MRRACEACGRQFEAKNKRHRFCGATCQKRGARGATVTPLDGGGGALEVSTRRQLEQAERAESPAGVQAILLARKLDQGGDTGSSMAALAKQHLAALEEALRDVPVADDPVDELTQRRRRRLAGG